MLVPFQAIVLFTFLDTLCIVPFAIFLLKNRKKAKKNDILNPNDIKEFSRKLDNTIVNETNKDELRSLKGKMENKV